MIALSAADCGQSSHGTSSGHFNTYVVSHTHTHTHVRGSSDPPIQQRPFPTSQDYALGSVPCSKRYGSRLGRPPKNIGTDTESADSSSSVDNLMAPACWQFYRLRVLTAARYRPTSCLVRGVGYQRNYPTSGSATWHLSSQPLVDARKPSSKQQQQQRITLYIEPCRRTQNTSLVDKNATSGRDRSK